MKKTKNKIGLRGRDVSKTHFSSGVVDPLNTNFSRIVIRFLEGQSLLASDLDTGKSDPICFIWFGSLLSDAPSLEELESNESVKRTKVCPSTTDPIWNQDITIPLGNLVNDLKALASMRILIFVRDADNILSADGKESTDYDELGMVELLMKNVIVEGKHLKSSIVQAASWHSLKKSPGMRRVDGKIKLTVSLIFLETDIPALACQILPEDIDSDAQNTTAAATMPALLKQLQSYHKSKHVRTSSNGFSSDGTGSPGSVRGSGTRRSSLDASSVMTSETTNKLPYRTKSASPARKKTTKKKLLTGNSLNILMEDPILESSDDAASEYHTDAYQTDADEDLPGRRRPKSAPPQVFSAARRYGSKNNDSENFSIHSESIENFDLHHDDTSDGEYLHGARPKNARNVKIPNSETEESDNESFFGNRYEKITENVAGDAARVDDDDDVVAKKQVVDRVGGRRREGGEYNKYDLTSDYSRSRTVPPRINSAPVEQRTSSMNVDSNDENFEFDSKKKAGRGEVNETTDKSDLRHDKSSSNDLISNSNGIRLDGEGAEQLVNAQQESNTNINAMLAEAADDTEINNLDELDDRFEEGPTLNNLMLPPSGPGDEYLPLDGPDDEFFSPDGPGDQFLPNDSPTGKFVTSEEGLREKLSASEGKELEDHVLATANFKEIKAVKNLSSDAPKRVHSSEVPERVRTDMKTQSAVPQPYVTNSDDDHGRPEITGTHRSMKSDNNNKIARANSDRGAYPNMGHQPREGNRIASGNSEAIDIIDRQKVTDFESNRRQKTKKGNMVDSSNSENYENANISTPSLGREFGRDDKIDDHGEQHAQNYPSASNTVPGQGSGAAVVRALRDIATQKKLMQDHLVELEKITRSGLSTLSGRLSNVESMIRQSANSREFGDPREFMHSRAAESSHLNYDDHYPNEYNASSNRAQDLAILEDSKVGGQVKGKARKAAAQDARAKTASEAVLKAQQVVEMLDNLPLKAKQPPRKGDAAKVPTSVASNNRSSRIPSDLKSRASKFKTAPEPIIRRNNSNNSRNPNEHYNTNSSNSNSKEKTHEALNDKNLDSQEDNMDVFDELLEFPDADNAPPPTIETKKKIKSTFREFLEKGSFPKGSNSSEPGISLLYKAPDGTVATAIHVASSSPHVEEEEEEVIPDMDAREVPRVESQGTLDTTTPVPATHPKQSAPVVKIPTKPSASPPRGDVNERFRYVLDNGSLSDIAGLMEVTGPLPESLSVGIRNRVYESIATLLSQPPLSLSLSQQVNNPSNLNNPLDKHIERCLVWVLALVRSRDSNLLNELVPHTKRDLVDALERPSKEPSKRGLLAALLRSQLQKFVTQ